LGINLIGRELGSYAQSINYSSDSAQIDLRLNEDLQKSNQVDPKIQNTNIVISDMPEVRKPISDEVLSSGMSSNDENRGLDRPETSLSIRSVSALLNPNVHQKRKEKKHISTKNNGDDEVGTEKGDGEVVTHPRTPVSSFQDPNTVSHGRKNGKQLSGKKAKISCSKSPISSSSQPFNLENDSKNTFKSNNNHSNIFPSSVESDPHNKLNLIAEKEENLINNILPLKISTSPSSSSSSNYPRSISSLSTSTSSNRELKKYLPLMNN